MRKYTQYLKRLAKYVICYLLAVIITVIVIGILSPANDEKRPSDAEILVSKWNISDYNDTLLVELPDKNGMKIGVSIRRYLRNGTLKAIGIVRDIHDDFNKNIVLSYVSNGTYAVPMAFYGSEKSGTQLVWWDYNVDGQFDLVDDFAHKTRKVNIGGNWEFGRFVPFRDNQKVFDTGENIYRFDPNSGEWKILDPNELPLERKESAHPFGEHDDNSDAKDKK